MSFLCCSSDVSTFSPTSRVSTWSVMMGSLLMGVTEMMGCPMMVSFKFFLIPNMVTVLPSRSITVPALDIVVFDRSKGMSEETTSTNSLTRTPLISTGSLYFPSEERCLSSPNLKLSELLMGPFISFFMSLGSNLTKSCSQLSPQTVLEQHVSSPAAPLASALKLLTFLWPMLM